MAKTRAIVKRLKAIRNIRKITRTMELIAAARFKKAFDRAVQAEAYTQKIAELAADLSASATDIEHPLLSKREEVKRSLLLVITSNRGLCGGYNSSVLRAANSHHQQMHARDVDVELEVSGKRGITYFRFQGVATDRTYTHFEDRPTFQEVDELATRYLEGYIQGEYDQIDIAYTKFISMARQNPVVETLLPLDKLTTGETKPAEEQKHTVEYEFLPNAKEILEEILPVSVKIRLFKCFLDAAVSEQIARQVAMKAATENAEDMLHTLTLDYNRARQSQITKEILEVIGGAEALK